MPLQCATGVTARLNTSWEGARYRSRAARARIEAVLKNPLTRLHPEPVFLLGNQRSGTTAIGAVLASVTGQRVALDLIREAYAPTFDLLKSGERSLDDLIRRNRFSFGQKIVKDPQLTPFYAELRERFPQARFALVVRDPRDNLRSLCDYLELPGHGLDQHSPRRVREWKAWQLVVDGTWLGIRAATPLEHLAHRWNLCADDYLQAPGSVALIRYEEFLGDKTGTVVSLARSLGMEVPNPQLAGVQADRPYQPRGAHRGVPVGNFFSAESLATIERICGGRMLRLGYALADGG